MDKQRKPTVIVPYPGPTVESGVQDIFICLRPETNGIQTESTMLKVIKSTKEYSLAMKLVYLANFPGEFIMSNNIVEQYCSMKLHFSVAGKSVFTPQMIQTFNEFFNDDFETCEIISPFNALERFSMEPEELFNYWVSEEDVCFVHGQSIKRIHGVYVMNYDIPALLHKNNKETDIAVMVFRTDLSCPNLRNLFHIMHKEIINCGVMNAKYDIGRAFHYSRSPLEQLIDGVAYLYTPNRDTVSMTDFTFAQYLIDRGFDVPKICKLLMNPIVSIQEQNGQKTEVNLYQYTAAMTYAETYAKIERIIKQHIIIHHGPLLQSICPQITV